ncbi:NADPH-dependent FMN reductase [Kitasatospora sp. NPDC051853]|uniref:NADPH-dependent FMN reductase n=1 Tax=Kitasatospora sp. NPDC051853 TaxID=3364058 RepID=UPI0037974FFE
MTTTAPTASTDRLRLAVIIGSTREGRFGPTVAHWFADRARRREDLDVDLVDLLDERLPDVLAGTPTPEVASLTPRLAAADAFVVVTPEYNHSYPAPLKSAIDWHRQEWQAKPVGFVSYGGIAGGLRAVEHLRQVFAEVHATTVRDTVSFHSAWELFDEAGQLHDPARPEGAAKTMLDQLVWWGRALRDAKSAHPYGN